MSGMSQNKGLSYNRENDDDDTGMSCPGEMYHEQGDRKYCTV